MFYFSKLAKKTFVRIPGVGYCGLLVAACVALLLASCSPLALRCFRRDPRKMLLLALSLFIRKKQLIAPVTLGSCCCWRCHCSFAKKTIDCASYAWKLLLLALSLFIRKKTIDCASYAWKLLLLAL